MFTSPGIGRDVQNCYSTCPRCQKAAKHTGLKSPLQLLPVIETPFHRIAFDLVGTLPRTKHGHQQILGSNSSEKGGRYVCGRVNGRCFSRKGIPYEMLTDQGSVFMGIKELCGPLLDSIL